MSIYDELRPVAASLLKEFKQGEVQLVNIVTSGDPDSPTNLETVIDLDAVCSGVSYRYVKDGFALESDLTVTASVVDGVNPSMNDFIMVDGVQYKIIRDISPPAAGNKIVWKFIVRRGA